MNDRSGDHRSSGAPPAATGPTIAFGFNRAKVPDEGEDSDPILRGGRDLALLAVFDGMGGAGGTVYETPDGPRTGAYIASRIARDVVERRMLAQLGPHWRLDGEAVASDLRRSVQEALMERLVDLNAPKSGLRSKLLRALPTTMALVALQRRHADPERWQAHVFWAGDSRAYAFEPQGARQLTTDDLRDVGDAMTNLRQDSVVGNAMSADVDFHVNHRAVELEPPFLVACATDGCFGYLRSPMHFEHLVLGHLLEAPDAAAWSTAVQEDIAAVTGDDAAMAMLAVGADLPELRDRFAARVDELRAEYLRPMDATIEAVAEAEAALEAAHARRERTTAELWGRYKPGYERYLSGDAAGRTDRDGGEEGDAELRDLLPAAALPADEGER